MKFHHAVFALCGTVAACAAVGTSRIVFRHDPPVALSTCSSCALVTEPDDGTAPLLAMIRSASRSVDLVIYELADRAMETALAEAEARGITVRVLLNDGYKGAPDGTTDLNASAFAFLRAHGVAVRATSASFDLTHQKTLVVDGAQALIMSFNLVKKYYPTGRDFGILDNNAADVAEIENVFNEDWRGVATQTTAGARGDLVWSPGSRGALLALVNGAHASLDIYNEEMADPAITDALRNAAARGVAVRIIMTYSLEWEYAFQNLLASGAAIRTYDAKAPLYIHAKVIVADARTPGARAFVGSENFSTASLEYNRELGIIVAGGNTIGMLEQTFNDDWRMATSMKRTLSLR